jgi:hypothetical protein
MSPARPIPAKELGLKPGEVVEVRSAAEIMRTLDGQGRLDGLPFMPEILTLRGHRFQVSKHADSTCARGQPRRLEATVHLDQLRCNGSAHRDCKAACLLLWKEGWLRRVGEEKEAPHKPFASARDQSNHEVVRTLLSSLTQRQDNSIMCQASELHTASCPLLLGSPPRYLANLIFDCLRGKIGRTELRRLGIYLWGKLILFAFTRWARAPWNAARYRKTPSQLLDLQPGEWVRVRRASEILRTLDSNACNWGMEFKAEMFQFCGRKYRVLARMRRRVDAYNGRLREFRNECIILDSVYRHGQRSFCIRGNYHYWREIWLRRGEANENEERQTSTSADEPTTVFGPSSALKMREDEV